jgi:hypothetical protein
MAHIENKLSRQLPFHRQLMPLTLASDETWLDDRSSVELSVGDLRYIIASHEKALSIIGEMSVDQRP